jgi:hypothetical protein
VIAPIEIPLNTYTYRFRRMNWTEEIKLRFKPGEDQRKVVLALALTDVSGLAVSRADALKILSALPEAILWRVWLVYRGNLPPDRYYSTGALYQAPDVATHHARNQQIEDQADETADRAMAAVEQADEVSRRMFEAARREGKLVPAKEDASG